MAEAQPQMTALLADARRWAARRSADPYDRSAREHLAKVIFALQRDRFPLGSRERGQHLLSIMGDAFPIAPVCDAYFENLEHLLPAERERPSPAQVVLGLGSGRCGSTSLTALLATIGDSCCTHENPPLVYWQPLDEQLRFHMRRFAILAKHFALVFDASHWWLNALDEFFARFPEGKIIGLHREIEACARSFLQRKALGRGSINHWAPPGNGIWRTNIWDPVYPTYPVPGNAASDPDGAKLATIHRYVSDYNARLTALSEQRPKQVLLVRTEELADAAAQRRIFGFLGLEGKVSSAVLNADTVADGSHNYWF